MRRFVEGVDRSQTTLFPESLDDWGDENNPVRVLDAFVGALDLRALGFGGVVPEAPGRPSYHPAILLKLYIDGDLSADRGECGALSPAPRHRRRRSPNSGKRCSVWLTERRRCWPRPTSRSH